MRILVMGLPGSGKTTFSKQVAEYYNIAHFEADVIRHLFCDWDFSVQGRRRQAIRMAKLTELATASICDFVCPKNEFIPFINPDYIIWMDTIEEGRYEDTNKLFEPPVRYDLRIKEWIGKNQLSKCLEDGNPGMMDILPFLKERLPKLVK